MQAVGLLVDVLVLEFDRFSLARRITAACDPSFGAQLIL
jgi:hypothetical protein